MGSRWANLIHSEQEIQRLASTTTSTNAPVIDLKTVIGKLYHQEYSADKYLCHYRSLVGDSPIQFLCDLGCCKEGCCSVQEMAQSSVSYGWAIGLLILFVTLVIFVLFVVGLNLIIKHTKKDEIPYGNGFYSSDPSQVNAPIYYSSGHLYTNKYIHSPPPSF